MNHALIVSNFQVFNKNLIDKLLSEFDRVTIVVEANPQDSGFILVELIINSFTAEIEQNRIDVFSIIKNEDSKLDWGEYVLNQVCNTITKVYADDIEPFLKFKECSSLNNL